MPFGTKDEHKAFIETYDARREELSSNRVVQRPIPRIDSSVVKRKTGRKKKYTPTRIKNEINKYFKFCEDKDEVPSIKGMMIHLKMYYETFYTYLRYPEFKDIMEHARMIISNWAENDVYQTRGMAAGKIAYMKNIHGWSEKLESNNITEHRVVSVEEAKMKLEQLAPKLLELMQETNVSEQIVTVEAEKVDDGK